MMWIKNFNYILFDFDGTLVNTEELHYNAYQMMCQRRGYTLPWSFERYCYAAHKEATGLRDQIYAEFPELHEKEPLWSILYEEKKKAYKELLLEGKAHLMPGVATLLESLQKENIPCCVVTHSPDEQISILRQQNPLLNVIPHWITRHDYHHPKPDPECYLLAIKKYAHGQQKIVGFEDTPRGLQALYKSGVESVLLCSSDYPFLEEQKGPHIHHFIGFDQIPDHFGK